MSDLEKLGGLEGAELQMHAFKSSSNPAYGACAEWMEALITKVKELERERQPMDACGHPLMFGVYDERKVLYVSCKICDWLQSARELAEMVERYYGSLQRHSVASKRILAKANEFLEDK